MSILSLCIIYLFAQYVLNEKQIDKLKHTLDVTHIMLLSIVVIPLFSIRPSNALNVCLAAIILNPILNLYGIKYRVENAQILDKDGPCVIVTKHQSSLDLI